MRPRFIHENNLNQYPMFNMVINPLELPRYRNRDDNFYISENPQNKKMMNQKIENRKVHHIEENKKFPKVEEDKKEDPSYAKHYNQKIMAIRDFELEKNREKHGLPHIYLSSEVDKDKDVNYYQGEPHPAGRNLQKENENCKEKNLDNLKKENERLIKENNRLIEELKSKDLKLVKANREIEKLRIALSYTKQKFERLKTQNGQRNQENSNAGNVQINPEELMFAAQLEQVYNIAEPMPNIQLIHISPNHPRRHQNPDNMTYEELLALEERMGKESKGYKSEDLKKLESFCFVGGYHPVSKNCVICQNDFKKGEDYLELKCSHEFHSECIKKWLKEDKGCPICKKEAL